MGHRANLIVFENNRYELFYSHWCANTLPRDLFWGPQYAVAFIRSLRSVDESGWLDEVWAEGGAVVDLDAKVLLLFGGEDLHYDVPLRRVYLQVLNRIWKGWSVRWAYEGIADIADYVHYPRHRVLTEETEPSGSCTLEPPGERDWTDIVGSVRLHDGSIRLFPLAGDLTTYLHSGPQLLEAVLRSKGLEQLLLDEWTREFPKGGFHLDLDRMELTFWIADDAPEVVGRAATAWPGWIIRWNQDRFESQLEQTKGRLRFPTPLPEELQHKVVSIVMHEDARSPVDTLLELTERDRREGKRVEINPFALRDDRVVLPRELRLQILGSIGIQLD